jgi:hypothetical protein
MTNNFKTLLRRAGVHIHCGCARNDFFYVNLFQHGQNKLDTLSIYIKKLKKKFLCDSVLDMLSLSG